MGISTKPVSQAIIAIGTALQVSSQLLALRVLIGRLQGTYGTELLFPPQVFQLLVTIVLLSLT